MAGTYDGGGNIRKGGFFVHYRDDFGRCVWAFVTSAHAGKALNLKEIPNSPDPMMWRPNVKHGTAKGQWHFPDQCEMTDDQMKEDEDLAKSVEQEVRHPVEA